MKEKNNTKSVRNPIILFIAVIALFCVFTGMKAYYEYLQFLEIGYQYTNIFFTNLQAKLITQAICLVVILIVFLINNFIIRKIIYEENADLKLFRHPVYVVLVTIVMALIASSIISGSLYENFLSFQNVTWFGETDPLFGWDLGYYIFTRPFYIALVNSIKGILLFNIIYTIVIYVLLQLRGGIAELKDIVKNKRIFIHSFVNLMLFIIATALVYKFNIEGLLYGTFCSVTGAGTTDMRVWSLYYKAAPFLLIFIVPISIYFLTRGRYKKAVLCILSFPALWVFTIICAVINQTVFVDANELTKESGYLLNNIIMTRKAYGLDTIQEQNYEVKNNLTYKDILANSDIISNTSIMSNVQILDSVNKQQSAGTYYRFNDLDEIPYTIDGQKKIVSVGAREVNGDEITKNNDSYVNKTYKYTHGTGVVMTDLNKTDDQGMPVFMIRDVPVLSDMGLPKINQPRIYYGEAMSNMVIVRTQYDEIDGNNIQSTYKYDGFGGVQMTWFNRMILAICGGEYKALFANQITNESRALINRNIAERVNKIAPFFIYDSDPYMIVTDNGELKWIMDAYAVTDQYPYSTRMGNINYIRNCAKVVIDAYNGNVTFYITDKENPFIQTYKKIYPSLFSSDDIPDDIKNHLRYPKDLFQIQAEVYKKYHVTDVASFYGNTDLWDLTKNKVNSAQYMPPYYTLVKQDEQPEMNLMITYTPYKNNNINAYLLGGSDANNYGQLKAYTLTQNKDNTAYGVTQIQNSINTNLAQEINQLGQNGAKVVMGDIKTLPVESSFLYIEPIYVITGTNTASKSSLARIAVVYNGTAVMDTTLSGALKQLFNASGDNKPPIRGEEIQNTPTVEQLLSDAIDMYARVKEYTQVGDWENYGKAMKEFDDIMARLTELKIQNDIEANFVGPRLDHE